MGEDRPRDAAAQRVEAGPRSYDVIIIDCPPSLNMLTLNALVAADSVLVPMQCEYYALEGLSALMGTIEQIKASVNPDLELEGILRTMFDPRNNLSNEVSGQLLMHFGDKVFRTVIPRNVRLAEAPSFGKAVLFHDKDSRGALAYLALAGEMIRREEELLHPAEAEPASYDDTETSRPDPNSSVGGVLRIGPEKANEASREPIRSTPGQLSRSIAVDRSIVLRCRLTVLQTAPSAIARAAANLLFLAKNQSPGTPGLTEK